MKKIIGLFFIVAFVFLLLPISNFIIRTPYGTALTRAENPQISKVASIFEKKCLNCHSSETKYPFYANFPVAKQILEHDISEGRASMDLMRELLREDESPISEAALAKIEYTIEHGEMPPLPYLMMHWDAFLSSEEKKTLLDWIYEVRKAHYASGTASQEFANDPLQPIPDKLELDEAKVALGEKMYNDTRLSADNSLSCASCHALDKGGTDQKPVSEGIRGQKGDINAPTVYNSAFQFAMFWDGRAADLEEQAAGPVHNPIEMGSNWEEVLPKLEQDPELVAEFGTLYDDGITGENITDAIAEFERSLITPDSAFDRYLKGDRNALTDVEREGLRLFKLNGCATCHAGKAMGGQSYEKMGVRGNYFENRGNVTKPDYGRYNFSNEEADRFKFKVPTLRNIEATWPYFHDASTSDLAEAVKIMAKYQGRRPFTDEEANQVAQFLRSLTGRYKGKKVV